MVALSDVRRFALSLPGALEAESYGGRPSWRTKARMFAWYREDPEALVVWVDSLEEKEAMLASEPEKFFTTDHYDGHAVALVRIEKVDAEELTELLTESWRIRAPKSAVKKWDRER